jgi:5'-nucleotidase
MDKTMTTILVTNDDGIHSPGLAALREAMVDLGRTVVVAPERDNSAVSHSLTMSRPLRLRKLAEDTYALDGTPTDCVVIGLGKVLTAKPDLLVSGINAGPNLGDDISYSGTVSAAVEGTMYGIPSLAVSLAGEPPYFYNAAMVVVRRLAAAILHFSLPRDTLININIPSGDKHRGIRITRQGRRLWENALQETLDPWGRTHYWIGGGIPRTEIGHDTDVQAIVEGYVSVTPIHLDLTNHAGITLLKNTWRLEKAEGE